MIGKIRLESQSGVHNYFLKSKEKENDITFKQLIVYGIPRSWDSSDSYVSTRKKREPQIIKYGIPSSDVPEYPAGGKSVYKYGLPSVVEPEFDSGNEPMIKYGVPDTDFVEVPTPQPRVDENAGADIPSTWGDLPSDETDDDLYSDPKKDNNPQPELKGKTSYFKRLWLAILGKDVK